MSPHYPLRWMALCIALAAASPSIAGERTCDDLIGGKRIIGGSEAHQADWGWQVSLRTDQSQRRLGGTGHFCGGSLISEGRGLWVVTAAHCLTRIDGSDRPGPHFRVMHGSQQITAGTEQTVSAIHVPPVWTGDPTQGADIALIKLSGALSIGNVLVEDRRQRSGRSIRQPTLPLQTEALESRLTQEGTCVTVTGWGATVERPLDASETTPEYLLEVTVPVVSNATCRQAYPELRPSMICAGYPEGGRDSCQGDSGGPLVVRGGPTAWSLLGVVSYGRGCGRANAHGVYTRVSSFQPWIRCVIHDGASADCWQRLPPPDFARD